MANKHNKTGAAVSAIPPAGFTEAQAFFYRCGGFSFHPERETARQGKIRCAKAAAKAEAWGKVHLSFDWAEDEISDSSDFTDERPAWALWRCCAYGEAGKVLASLHGIDFGRRGEPWGDNYKRVVEAELSAEVMREGGK